MADLGVVVIGAGEMGSRHAQHWTAAGANVVAVCDPNLALAQRLAASVNAEACPNPDALLAKSDIDVVSVCTPTFLHPRYTLQALEAGKHVLCEKPIALNLESALEMKRVAESKGLQLRIGLMRRFEPIFPNLKEMVDDLGMPVMGNVTITAGIRAKRLMHDRTANGGPVIDMCCHIFDLWALIFGEKPELVYATGNIFAEHHPALASIKEKAIDSATATFRFLSGHTTQLLVTWGLPEGVPFSEQHIYIGSEGRVEVDWNYQNNSVKFHDGVGLTHYNGVRDPWESEIRQFYLELTQNAPRQVADADEGIAALKLSLKMLEAIE